MSDPENNPQAAPEPQQAAIDPNDPATWPSDIDGLEALANGGAPDSSPIAAQANDGWNADIKEPPATAEPPKVEPVPVPTQSEPVPQPQEDAAAVLAKDGKNLLPFQVVADLREENKGLRNALEVALAKQQTAAAADATQQPAQQGEVPMHLRPQAEIDAHIAQVRDEYGDLLADLTRDNLEMKRDRAIDMQSRQADAEKSQQERQSALQQAIEGHPLMKTWQGDPDKTWYNNANLVFQTLAERDPNFRGLPPDEQIKLVAERTEGMFGKSPHSAKLAPAPAPATQQPAQAAAVKPQTRVPTSMSEIPGGAPPAMDARDQYENMSGAALTHHLMGLKGDQLNRELARLGVL